MPRTGVALGASSLPLYALLGGEDEGMGIEVDLRREDPELDILETELGQEHVQRTDRKRCAPHGSHSQAPLQLGTGISKPAVKSPYRLK